MLSLTSPCSASYISWNVTWLAFAAERRPCSNRLIYPGDQPHSINPAAASQFHRVCETPKRPAICLSVQLFTDIGRLPPYVWKLAAREGTFGVCSNAAVNSDLFCFLWSWWRVTVVERRSLAGELSLSCARPAADGWPLMWVSHPL